MLSRQRSPAIRQRATRATAKELSGLTRVGKLKLVCLNDAKTVGKHVGNWRQIELAAILAIFSPSFFYE